MELLLRAERQRADARVQAVGADDQVERAAPAGIRPMRSTTPRAVPRMSMG
ncbi:hypothetical protein [Amycolatopsis sp. DSM 110486]|uniref:hypothetical protein n=1 Tax=Amycolatopsis sp. DSM 110486 TaxID=2865832 RepID=UPI0021028A12|nr:hypothetical protein [Amycolatopsis sp. DSM 110486]